MLPEKETKYSYSAFQARDRRDKSECDSAVYSSLHGTQGCHLVFFNFLIPKLPQNTNICIWQPRWNMISPAIFAGALTIFAGALPPWAPPWWRGRIILTIALRASLACALLLIIHTCRQARCGYIIYCSFVCLFVCTVTDFSAEDKTSGVKFCTAIHRNLPFLWTLLPQKPKIGRIGQRAGHARRDIGGVIARRWYWISKSERLVEKGGITCLLMLSQDKWRNKTDFPIWTC